MALLGPLLGVSLTPGSAGTAVSTERGQQSPLSVGSSFRLT